MKYLSKSLKYALTAVCFLLLNNSCNEILETTPFGLATSAEFWRNAEDAVAAINAVYQPFTTEAIYGHSENVFDNCSDDLFRAGDHGYEQAMEEFTLDADNLGVRQGWNPKYEIVSRANAVLMNVPNINMDPALKNRIIGEALFLRAFIYWRFSVIYGGVPLILEEDVLSANYNKPRATVQDIRTKVEADLIRAADLLPESYTGADIGRVHKGSANALLTKLYLYEEQWAKAIESGNKVMNGPYPLSTNYAQNFRIATKNNPEILFSIQALDGWITIAHRIYSTPRPWGGWDFHEPTQNVVDEFEDGDPRLAASVMRPGDVIDLGGTRGPTVYTSELSLTGYHLKKFAEWNPGGGLSGSVNVPVLRAADVYLMVAEAKIRSGQNGDAELNAVRARAGLTPKTNATMADIIHERRVELLGENERHSDLIRWDKAGIVDIVDIYAQNRPFDPPRNFIRPKHYLFPIPQREIDLSNGVLTQNPGY